MLLSSLATRTGRLIATYGGKSPIGFKSFLARSSQPTGHASQAKTAAFSHLRTVLRDRLVSLTISRTDFFSRKNIRLTLPIQI